LIRLQVANFLVSTIAFGLGESAQDLGVLIGDLPLFGLTVCPGRASLCLPREECGGMADLPGISEKVRAVSQMGRSELVSEWQSQFGAPPPPKLRVELMRPVLVYRIQENAWGLSGSGQKARIHDLSTDANRRSFKAGTKIIREWKGQLHEVAVTTEGYVYNGAVYKSLSPIATRITGTRWSGPAFFGTKPKESSR
jgi:hypothetical protein